MATRRWCVFDALRVLAPVDCAGAYAPSNSKGPTVVSVIPIEEALPLAPYKEHDSLGFNIPMNREQGEAEAEIQRGEHEKAVAGKTVCGYVRWLTPGSLSDNPGHRILVRESGTHTGLRIWEATWLHRTWALKNAALLLGRSVLELGAGCGLLGLSIACACAPESVILSDFQGHFESKETVMQLLRDNVASNMAALPHDSVAIQVVELDWARPTEPQEWRLPSAAVADGVEGAATARAANGSSVNTRGGEPQPCDVIIGTELVYSAEGGILLAGVLPIWLNRSHGAFYLLNNSRRSGVPEFLAACAAHGLYCEQVDVDRTMEAISAFGSGSCANEDDYSHFKVTWKKSTG